MSKEESEQAVMEPTGSKASEPLEIPVRLSFPVIKIDTFEFTRAELVMENVADNVGKMFVKMPFKRIPIIDTLKEYVDKAKKDKKLKGVLIFDPYFSERCKTNPETKPALKSSLFYLEQEGVNYVICSQEAINDEFVYHSTLPPMQHAEIEELILTCEKNIQEEGVFSQDERRVIANYAPGLSHTQMKNVFTYSAYLKYKDQEYLGEIVKEKNHILHKRLETMLNEVIDTVNTDQTAARLAELTTRKDTLQNDMDVLEKEIKEWEDTFREANDGKDPTEDKR